MKKKVGMGLGVLFSGALVLVFAILAAIRGETEGVDIAVVLNSEEYTTLNDETKDFIERIYNNTGEVVLVEGNKESNQPYLNPDYEAYLGLSDEEKAKVEVIPEVYVLDYWDDYDYEVLEGLGGIGEVKSGSSSDDEILVELDDGIDIEDNAPLSGETTVRPASFDLRDVDGKRYIGDLRTQGNLGICWIIATEEQVESLMMWNWGRPFDEGTIQFSARQADFATSSNGIRNYVNENGYRELGRGGTFAMVSAAMSNGVALVRDDGYNESQEQKSLSEVMDYSKSLYEVNNTVMMPMKSAQNEAAWNSYDNLVKDYVRAAGGAYVATGSPQGACGALNADGTFVIADNDNCHNAVNYSGHAMQIIGWDDNYKYNYCVVGGVHAAAYSDGKCTNGTPVSGSGAWLLRNSWGEGPYDYVYLTYSSTKVSINFVTGISSMNSRKWDNNYNYYYDELAKEEPSYGANVSQEFDRENYYSRLGEVVNEDLVQTGAALVNKYTAEKIEKIKFMVLNKGQEYTVKITGLKTGDYETTLATRMPGIYTLNLSSEDLLLSEGKFAVSVESEAGAVLNGSVAVFTSNVEKQPYIKTADVVTKTLNADTDELDFVVRAVTRNIPDGTKVKYELVSAEGDEAGVEHFTISEAKVAHGLVNAEAKLGFVGEGALGSGKYTLVASYGDYTSESYVEINMATNQGDEDNTTDVVLIPPKINEDATLIIKDNSVLRVSGGEGFGSVANKIENGTVAHYDLNRRVVTSDGLRTGDVVVITANDGSTTEYVVAIAGDVSGDGRVSTVDYARIRKHILGTDIIGNDAYGYAADVNGDGKISTADYARIRKYIINGGTL